MELPPPPKRFKTYQTKVCSVVMGQQNDPPTSSLFNPFSLSSSSLLNDDLPKTIVTPTTSTPTATADDEIASTTTTTTGTTPHHYLQRIPQQIHDPILHGYVQFWFGRDITTPNEKGDTPLLEAAENGDESSVTILLLCRDRILREKGIDILRAQKSEGYTALHVAALEGHTNIVQLLVNQKGIDVDLENDYGQTSLHIAADFGEVDVARLLLDHGANVNFQNSSKKLQPSTYNTSTSSSSSSSSSLLLLAGEQQQLLYQKTPLHCAAAMGYEIVVRLLCTYGANVNLQYGVENKTALYDAAELGNEKTVLELLKHGADPNRKTKAGCKPLLPTWQFYPTSPFPWRREISKQLLLSEMMMTTTRTTATTKTNATGTTKAITTTSSKWNEISLVGI